MKRAFLIGAAAFGLSLGAAAQGAPQGGVFGVVLDAATQRPIEGATVTARSAALLGEQSAVTDANGFFEMTMLPASVYRLAVSHDGYATFEPGGLDVKTRRVRVKITLEKAEAPPPPPVAAAAPPIPAAPEFDPATMTAPVMVSGPAPEYTDRALEEQAEGTVVLRCVVTAGGAVRGCAVKQSVRFMDRACIDALQARRYKPATQAGKPIDVLYTFTIRLKLPAIDREFRR